MGPEWSFSVGLSAKPERIGEKSTPTPFPELRELDP